MQLSYISRLICLTLCGAAALQLALECLAWLLAPSLLQRGMRSSARSMELSLFSLALLTRLGPWLAVLGAWLPAYVRDEDNLSPEHVGLAPIVAASCGLVFWLAGCVRLVHGSLATQRLCRRCKPAGTSPEGLPLLLHPGPQPLLAVAGIFRPRIIVSNALLTPGQVSPAALEVALLHEGAHARHRDNLKRAILSLLPHIYIATSARPSLEHHWQLAAEIAADEAGALGIPERSILLADLLVKMARGNMPPALRGAFALLSRAGDLRFRVERLLPMDSTQLLASASTSSQLRAPFVFAATGAVLAALCCLGVQAGHRLSEILLHIG